MLQQFFVFVLPALVKLSAMAVAAGAAFLHGKLSALLAAKVHNEKLGGALTLVNDIMQTVVLDLNQTVRAEFEAAAADGKISSEEAAHLKAVALTRAKTLLGEAGLLRLKDALGIDDLRLGDLLAAKVEAKVAETKLPPFYMSQELGRQKLEAARQ